MKKRFVLPGAALALILALFVFSLPPAGNAAESELLEPIGAVGKFLDDTAMTTELKIRLASEKGLEGTDIHVTTTNGVVRLDGVVNTSSQSALAEEVVRKLGTAKGVANHLKVK